MKKGGKMNGSMDKKSSAQPASFKMKTHVKAPAKTAGLDMTKSHPLHTGRPTKNPYGGAN